MLASGNSVFYATSDALANCVLFATHYIAPAILAIGKRLIYTISEMPAIANALLEAWGCLKASIRKFHGIGS